MSDQNTERDAIARRIRALMAKTTENGATEQEALAAAEKARALMDAHRLSQTDVEIEAEPLDTLLVDRPTAHKLAAVDYCLYAIDKYCGVKTWYATTWPEGGTRAMRVKILGLRSDAEMAKYLYEMIAATIKVETARYAAGQPSYDAGTTRRRNQSFQVGMATRVASRLSAMARELAPTAKTGSGTALVVVKNAVVEQAYANLGLKFGRSRQGLSANHSDAYHAGRAAGDRVNLSRPVSGGAQSRIA